MSLKTLKVETFATRIHAVTRQEIEDTTLDAGVKFRVVSSEVSANVVSGDDEKVMLISVDGDLYRITQELTSLKEVLASLDPDTILIDHGGERWTPDNIDWIEEFDSYCIDGDAIWGLNEQGYRTIPVLSFEK